MPNPFGITEVDIPGALGAYEAGQTARVNRLYRMQQLQMAEREADRQQGIQQVMARFSGGAGGKGAAGAYPSPAQPNVGQQVASGINAAAGVPQPPAAPAPARPQFRDAIPELLALGMEPAQVQALANLNDAQSASVVTHWQQLGPLYAAAARLPYEQRRAYIASVAPELEQLGVSREQSAAFDPTDANLSSHIALGTTMAQALEPRLMSVEGEVIDQRALPQATPGSPVVFRSQYISTPQGLAERPGGGSTQPASAPPQVGEVRRGYRFNGGDPANPQSWTPEGGATRTGSADLDNWNAAGRGGSQGPRTFR